jgi:hypothetical protein
MQQFKRTDHFLFLFPLLLILTGCAGTSQKPELDADRMTAVELRDRVERNYLGLTTLQGSSRIQIQMPGMGTEATTQVKIILPDSLLLKIEAIFGIDVGSFSSNRKKFALYSPMQKVLYTGHQDSLDLSQFFQVNITYQELIEAFMGTPKIQLGKNSEIKIDQNQYLLSVVTDDGVHRYWIHPQKFVVTESKFFNSGGVLQTVKLFSKFSKYGNSYLPKIVQIQKPAEQQIFSLFYDSRELNKPIDRELFKLRVPPKTRHIRL